MRQLAKGLVGEVSCSVKSTRTVARLALTGLPRGLCLTVRNNYPEMRNVSPHL